MANKNVRVEKNEIAFIEAWIKTVSENKNVSPQDFVKDNIGIKERAIEAFESITGVNKRTGESSDFLLSAIVKVLQENEDKAREEILKLVYKGEVNPMAYYEVVMKIMKDHSLSAHAFQDMRKINIQAMDVKAAKGCGACAACAGCTLCAACGLSGTVAAGAAGMAGAAAVYLA